jgi:uncharacterized protein
MATFLKAHWENIIMANYEIDPAIVLPYLPKGVELDLYKEKAYVSLVGFMFKNTQIFKVPIPKLGSFEEINLRFYVKRIENGVIKRGVVFINETVPYKLVAWVANLLYRENYTCVPTKHRWNYTDITKNIKYQWKKAGKWNTIEVAASKHNSTMVKDSFEEFIFEHYYGYTKVNHTRSEEYTIAHPSWLVNEVHDYTIDCDFRAMYGDAFASLNHRNPASVFIAEGSAVSIEWKRKRF